MTPFALEEAPGPDSPRDAHALHRALGLWAARDLTEASRTHWAGDRRPAMSPCVLSGCARGPSAGRTHCWRPRFPKENGMPWIHVGNKFKTCNKQMAFKQCLSFSFIFFFFSFIWMLPGRACGASSWHLTWMLSPHHPDPWGRALAQPLGRRGDPGSVCGDDGPEDRPGLRVCGCARGFLVPDVLHGRDPRRHVLSSTSRERPRLDPELAERAQGQEETSWEAVRFSRAPWKI